MSLRMGRWLRVALCVLGLSSSVGLVWAQSKNLAVWPFEAQSMGQMLGVDESSFLEHALPDVIATEFARAPSLHLVERQKLLEILQEQKLGSSDLADEETRLRLGRLLGAHYMLFGNYMRMGDSWRLDARVVSVETSQVLSAGMVTGGAEDVIGAARGLSADLLGKLGVATSEAGKRFTTKVWQRYEQALEAMSQQQWAQAAQQLESLLKDEPSFELAGQRLVEVAGELARQ